jgi:hypothetical protein
LPDCGFREGGVETQISSCWRVSNRSAPELWAKAFEQSRLGEQGRLGLRTVIAREPEAVEQALTS